jgi:DNA ligase D-like protein (predicted 3'-phosphoesterase)
MNKHRPPRFVIRDEATDSYDLRLEIDGVLASWTVPKDRRLARRAGDHPLGRAANDVAVVDRGTYANATAYAMAECLERGYLSFHLRGEQISSRYSLTRVREGEDETWLLMRREDGLS